MKTLSAPRRSWLRARRPSRADPGAVDPEPVAITRLTVIPALGFAAEEQAHEWLERCREQAAERDAAVESALRLANRAIQAHRVAAADPYAHDVTRSQAHAARLGYGSGEQVADGQWRAALTLPPPGFAPGARRMLGPQEQTARILSGRRPVRASEDLVLRARLDLEQGRPEQAALQLETGVVALRAELKAELRGEGAKGGEEPAELALAAAAARELSRAAAAGSLGEQQVATLSEQLATTERMLRRRRHRGDAAG